jgi:hypothetical protein
MKLLLLALIVFLASATPSYAETKCNNNDDVMRTILATKYNEASVQTIVLSEIIVLEVFASPDYITWSIIVVSPSKSMACMVEYGKGYDLLSTALEKYLGSET